MAFDLHTHTTCSDGTTSPEDNAALAAAAGLTGLAVSDHDTTDGWERAAGACDRHGIEFVPGIELSAELSSGRSVHVLGYWCDAGDDGLVAECGRLRGERERRARLVLSRLAALGVELSWEAVARYAGDAPVGRPHIAAALVALGAVPDHGAAFARYLGDGAPAYVPKRALAPEDAVRLLRAAGGVPVLAHPGRPRGPVAATPPASVGVAATGLVAAEAVRLIDRMVAAGLVGIEGDHASNEPPTAAAWREVALERGLVVTGSSDFHGDRKDVRIGQRTTSAAVVDALRSLAPAVAGVVE